jgi:ribokinase
MKAKIIVIGSINMDIVNHVKSFPKAGETIKGLATEYNPGGKGANQAVAASLSGGNVIHIGAVGDDAFGEVLLKSLSSRGVNTKHVITKTGSSGLAFITVNHEGQNHIVLSEGANAKLSVADIKSSLDIASDIAAILFQNEVPWETTKFAMDWARSKGIKVYYNPAPAMEISRESFPLIDTIILNETESHYITGLIVSSFLDAEKVADLLVQWGVRAAILTLGEKGSLYKDKAGRLVIIPAFKVEPNDTTAAGDTFIGAFVIAQTEGTDIEGSLSFASAAAALSVSRKGAQASIPHRQEIETFIKSR